MRKLSWLTVLLALFSVAACEKTKPAGKAHEHKDGQEHKEGDAHDHKEGDGHKEEKK